MTTLDSLFRPLSRLGLAAGLAAAIGFVAPASIGYAQQADGASVGCDPGAHPHGRRHRRGRGAMLRRMAQQLDLTDAQRQQIQAILQDARSRRGQPGLRGQVQQQIQSILTPAQRAQAAELRRSHRADRLQHRLSRMTERLGLDATQQQQVRGILRNAAMQRRALREQAADDPASARAAMRALRERTQASIRSVLTVEQAAALDEMRENRARHPHRGRRGGRGQGGPGGR